MHELQSLLDELEEKIAHYAAQNPEVSQAHVGWHVEHTLLALANVIKAVEHSDPQAYQHTEPNPALARMLEVRRISRGRAAAPAATVPPATPTPESLSETLAKAKLALQKLPTLHPDQHFVHGVLGTMNTALAAEFLLLHTRHHLAIINDILQPKNA